MSASEVSTQITRLYWYSDPEARLGLNKGVCSAHFIATGEQRVGEKGQDKGYLQSHTSSNSLSATRSSL